MYTRLLGGLRVLSLFLLAAPATTNSQAFGPGDPTTLYATGVSLVDYANRIAEYAGTVADAASGTDAERSSLAGTA